ncbi:hypothetical protein FOZ63_004059, partial [Perkinsus olseni]
DRPSGRRPFQTALSELRSLQAQYGQGAGMSNLGSGTRDACYSAWKERNKASEASVGVSARRESSNEPFHLDCVSFQRRFYNTTPYDKFSDPFRETFSEEGRLNTFKYVAKYYVNLKYFMTSTELESGNGSTCKQQLDMTIKRDFRGLSVYKGFPEYEIDPTHFGEYRLALRSFQKISSGYVGRRQEFWALDQAGTKRGVELRQSK